MPYKFESELRNKAEIFIKDLIQAGVAVEPYPVMFRDYTVKLAVQNKGCIKIHYSPKKGLFSINLDELRDKGLETVIENCWQSEESRPVSIEVSETKGYQAYVDGSYIEGFVGYGAVILYEGQEIKRFSGSVEQYVEQRQVVGELQAAMEVVAWCEENKIDGVEIFYDYEGIQKWATNEWRANNEATQQYKKIIQASSIHINWHKVKSHTGVYWNEIVDELAKQGALSQISETNANDDDPIKSLEKKALNFVAYLADQGIKAEFTKIYNGQYARIVISGGYFDIYNTRKRPMSPYIHNFNEKTLSGKVEEFWERFHSGRFSEINTEAVNNFEEIEYYLAVFAPYRDLAFDFRVLAKAIQPFLDTSITLPTDNYDELERVYQQVLGQNND